MTSQTKLIPMIKKSLNELAPGMQFKVSLTKPKYAGTHFYTSVEVEYNETLAAERGVNQKMLREAVKKVVDAEAADSWYAELGTLSVSLKPKEGVRRPDNSALVSHLVDEIGKILQNAVDQDDVARQVVAVIGDNLSGDQKKLLADIAAKL